MSRRQPLYDARVAATAAYGALAATWAYVDQRQIDFSKTAYEVLDGTIGTLAFILLAVLTGWFVGRSWVLLALIGPLASLGYLQATGYVSPWHDGERPLTSMPSAAIFFWLGILLLIGVGISRALRKRAQRRPH